MSKERARRRAEREAEAARRAALRERRAMALARRQARRERLLGWLPRRRRPAGRQGLLAARRRRRIGLLVLGFVVLQFLVWVSTPDWGVRLGVLVVSVLALPLAAALTL